MKPDPAEEIARVMKREKMDADKLGYNRTALWKILTGRISPTWGTIRRIFDALGYDVFVHAKRRKRK
jgi:transcriptional regulator with XRE-family HTH domain